MVKFQKYPEKFKTLKGVFDPATERTLFKLISQGHFDGLESPITIGKEANIFTARKGNEQVIAKIYRITTCDFNKMYNYLQPDPRFPRIKKQRRKIIFAWARREYRNLLKAREAGVRVPTPLAVMQNVLVIEYIGDEKGPARKVKDLAPKNPKQFMAETVKNVKKLYKAGLIHADLSSFNILNFNEKPVFIDFSQATTLENPNAKEYLARDIRNLCTMFKKLGLEVSEEELKKMIED